LALGAAIAAGLDGVERGMELPPPVAVDPGIIPEADRLAAGIEQLPTHLGRSIELLEKDEVLLDALGPELARAFLSVRRAEWDTMKDWTLDMEVALLLDRY
jgi:glutamine synthetase